MTLKPIVTTVRLDAQLFAVTMGALCENAVYIIGWPDDDYQAVYSYSGHGLMKSGYAFVKLLDTKLDGVELVAYLNEDNYLYKDVRILYRVEVRHLNYVNIDDQA